MANPAPAQGPGSGPVPRPSSACAGPSRTRLPRTSLSSTSTSSSSSPSRHRTPGPHATRRVIPRSSSAYVRSPSKLPHTDTMSYFPPFECMGSTSTDEEEATEDRGTARGSHSKGRSLGSLAGIISFLSPGAGAMTVTPEPISKTHSSPGPRNEPGSPTLVSRSTSDGAALEALSKKVTPGKRRVLEPMMTDNEIDIAPPTRQCMSQRRRWGSEVEVENLLTRRRERVASGKREIDDELIVETLVGDTPDSAPLLNLPLPSLPIWRYPIPSPPVASICPELSLEAFAKPIENPLKATSTTTSLSSRRRSSASSSASLSSHISRAQVIDDFDQVEDDLSPTVSNSVQSFSNPETPKDKPSASGSVKINFVSPSPTPPSVLHTSSPRGVGVGVGSLKSEKDKMWYRPQDEACDGEKTIKARATKTKPRTGSGSGNGKGEKENWELEMSPRSAWVA